MRILAFALPALLAMTALPSRAGIACTDTARCDRPDLVAELRVGIAVACPCDVQTTKRAYRRCAKLALKELLGKLGKGEVPKPCRKDITRSYKNATCGRSDVVACNRTNRKGRTKCVIATVARCPVDPGRSSPCGAFTSCTDACMPDGGCPAGPPPTSTSSTTIVTTSSSTTSSTSTSTTTTTMTSSSTTTSTILGTTSTSVIVTTTSTTSTTTLPTTLPCADVNLGAVAPVTVMGTTAGAGNDVEPPPGCLSLPLGGGEDVLYEWTAPAAGIFVFDTRRTPFDSVVAVLDGCGGTVVACNDDPEGFGVLGSRAEASLGAGQTVLVVVDSADQSGSFALDITGPFGTTDCCVAHGASGCDEPSTESCVCGADAVCCSDTWDDLCVWRAIDRCAATCD